jgi:hypothetical protein
MPIYTKAGEGAINQLSIDSEDVLIDPYTQNPIYQFGQKYLLNQDLNKVSTGISVGLATNTNFEFDISNRLNQILTDSDIEDDVFFNGIKVDILNKNSQLIFNDFTGGFINTFEFTKEENISKFGAYQKDFGIRVNIDDKTNLSDHVSEFYVYRNPLYIKNVSVTDKDGLYFNPQPIGYQSYVPIVEEGQYLTPTDIGANSFYVQKYKLTINNKNILFNFKIVFAKQTQESIKITWGDSTENIPFYYNNGVFVGPGVTVTNTATNDLIFLNAGINQINGKTYEFTVPHDYISNDPQNYILNILLDDINLTQYQQLSSYQAFIPNAFTANGNGILVSKESISGKIDFKVNFSNDPSFTSFDKVSIYGRDSSNVLINSTYFIKDAPLFTPDSNNNYNFYIGEEEIKKNKNYWFYLVPHSESATGFAWKVGPYKLDKAIVDTRADIAGKSFSTQGLKSFSFSEIKEGELLSFDESVIDKIELGSGILCSEYLASVISDNKDVCSSKIIITNNFENLDELKQQYYITEYAISENSFIDYFVEESDSNLLLKAKINNNIDSIDPTAFYVVHKTNLYKLAEEDEL